MTTRLACCAAVVLAACGGSATDDDAAWHECCDGGVDVPDASSATATVCASGAEFTSINAAIASLPDGGSVQVCAGTYHERIALTDRSIALRGAGAGLSILDADHAGTAASVSGGRALTIEGFTVVNGTDRGVRCADSSLTVRASTLSANAGAGGGGLYAQGCTIDLDGVTFDGNEGGDWGGGALITGSTGAIVDATFTGNTADEGGGLYLLDGDVAVRTSTFSANHARARGGALYQKSDGAVEDTTFTGNSSEWTAGGVYTWQHAPAYRRVVVSGNTTAWEGGGMYFHQSEAILEDSQISSNTSVDDGGGLRLFESRMTVSRNVIDHNASTDGDGGGFKSSHLPSVFTDNHLVANEALGAGGGAEFDNDSSQWHGGSIRDNRASIGGGVHAMRWPWNDGVIADVEISTNHAWRGGGVYLEDHFQTVELRGLRVHGNHANQGAGVYTRGTPLVLTGSVIDGNLADDLGGGVMAAPSSDVPWTEVCPCPPIDPAASISFVTVHGNTADGGAGAWIKAPNVSITGSIFSGHTTTGVQVDLGRTPTWRYNDTYPATFTGMVAPTGSNGNVAADPAFLGAGDFHLAPTSPLRDAGDPAIDDADGSRADMGAYAGPTPMP